MTASMGRPNREILSGGKRYKDAKKFKSRVSEVVFDKEKRKDYLTGFHKRKLERKKKAQDYLEEQAKKDRLEERARIREERKLQVQKKLAEMKEAMELNPFLEKDQEGNSSDNTSDDDSDILTEKNVGFEEGDNESGTEIEERNGKDEDDQGDDRESNKMTSGILKKQIYEIDNDSAPVSGTSEVVIESLDNPNTFDLDAVTKKMNVDLSKTDDVLSSSITRAKKYARLMGMSDSPEEKEKVSKPKKKKFRYLSKTERKMKNMKEKNKSFKKRKKE